MLINEDGQKQGVQRVRPRGSNRKWDRRLVISNDKEGDETGLATTRETIATSSCEGLARLGALSTVSLMRTQTDEEVRTNLSLRYNLITSFSQKSCILLIPWSKDQEGKN